MRPTQAAVELEERTRGDAIVIDVRQPAAREEREPMQLLVAR